MTRPLFAPGMRQVVNNLYWTVSVSLKCVSYLESGRLREVVAYERCGLYERVECRSKRKNGNKIILLKSDPNPS